MKEFLALPIGPKIQESEMRIEVFSKGGEAIIKGLFVDNQARQGGNCRLLRILTKFHQGDGYVTRNASDLAIQFMSVQEENKTVQNEIGGSRVIYLGEMGEMVQKNRLGGQRTDLLGRSLSELSTDIAKKTHENFGNAGNQPMGVAESLTVIGPDSRNLGQTSVRRRR